jgi:predicted glutamine amidotransferase
MCGIVGVIKDQSCDVTYTEFLDFLYMLEKAQERGRQATGVALILQDGRSLVFKAPETAEKVVPFIRYFTGVRAIFGHTRLSTGGSPSVNSNNHPHEDNNWILIHNGTVDIEHKLKKDLNCSTECDTEYFIRMFTHQTKTYISMEDMFKKSFANLSGSWSLAFYSKVTKEIFISTNGRSPFEYWHFGDGIYFASLSSYIMGTVKANKKKIKGTTTLGKNIVYKYKGNGFITPLCTYEHKEVSYAYSGNYNRRSTGYHQRYNDLYDYDDNIYYYQTTKPKKKGAINRTAPVKQEEDNNIIDFYEEKDALMYGVSYVVHLDILEYAYPYSPGMLESAALEILENNPELYNLNPLEVVQVRNRRKSKKSLPRSIKLKITTEFAKVFADAEKEALNLVPEDEDYIILSYEGKILSEVLTLFKWYDRVLAVKYGLYIESIVASEFGGTGDLLEEEDLEKQEISDL